MPGLIVNLNAVAALRAAGGATGAPDPAAAAVLAELGGAAGAAVHYRPDHPLVAERDLRVLREVVRGRFVLGMSPTPEMAGLAMDLRPDRVTLLLDGPEGAVGPAAVDPVHDRRDLGEFVAGLRSGGLPVFLLVDPDADAVKLAHRLDADGVQLHTGRLAGPGEAGSRQSRLARVVDAAKLAARLRLSVTAGCGITHETAPRLAGIGEIQACVVGHALVSRALFVGMENAVRDFVVHLESR